MIVKKGYTNIKRTFKSRLRDLSEVVKIIREKLENQLHKIHFQHTLDKNGNIKAILNISWFYYLKYGINKHALSLMVSHTKRVNAMIVLS